MIKIDAHQHFWRLDRGDYSWLTSDLEVLYRDFVPGDLEEILADNGVSQTVAVQAADTVDETRYLLDLANTHGFISGVVGWIDFDADDAISQLESLAKDPLFKGVRPMLQDIQDDEYILNEKYTPIFEKLAQLNLSFDVLIKPKHLGVARQLVVRHPNVKFVIDHGAKPDIASASNSEIIDSCNVSWARNIESIARYPHVYCKLSGLVTEASSGESYDVIALYMRHLYSCFGPEKLMWGSDWPVVTLSQSYDSWHNYAERFINELSLEEQKMIFAGTAARFYNLEVV